MAKLYRYLPDAPECVTRNRDHLWVERRVNKRKGCLQQLGQPGYSTSTAKPPVPSIVVPVTHGRGQ